MKIQDCLYKTVCTNKCHPSCVRYNQMNRLIELSNIPKIYINLKLIPVAEDIEKYKSLKNIKDNIDKFVDKGQNLYICSDTTGNAKTSWAIKMMLKYFDLTWHNSYDITRGLFVHIPSLLLDLKNFKDPPEYLDRILEADLVIWDDLGFTTKLTDFEHEQLLHFIDYRLTEGKSNIYTSNITSVEDLNKIIGYRLGSRIFKESQVFKFNGKDFRKVVNNDGGND